MFSQPKIIDKKTQGLTANEIAGLELVHGGVSGVLVRRHRGQVPGTYVAEIAIPELCRRVLLTFEVSHADDE